LEAHSADPAHEGRWAVETAQALGAVATRDKLGGACSLAVPGHLALTKFIKTPSVAAAKRTNIIAFEAAENIPHPLNEVVWDHLVVADDSFDLEVMLHGREVRRDAGALHGGGFRGLRRERAIPSALALCHAFRYNYPEVSESVVVANVGARSTHLLFMEGKRFYLRTLALAGNTVTQAVADELRIDFASAETLKIQVLAGNSDLPAGSPSRAAAVHRAAADFPRGCSWRSPAPPSITGGSRVGRSPRCCT
jgi:type IV pilus assembly protein PilM